MSLTMLRRISVVSALAALAAGCSATARESSDSTESDLSCKGEGQSCGWGLGKCCAGACTDTGDHTHFVCKASGPVTPPAPTSTTPSGGTPTTAARTYSATGLPMALKRYDFNDKSIRVADTGTVGHVSVHFEVPTIDRSLLVVSLIHDGRFEVLHHNGGRVGEPGLTLDVDTSRFAGSKREGDWTLRVRSTFGDPYATELRAFSVTIDGRTFSPLPDYGSCDLFGQPCDWEKNNILGENSCCGTVDEPARCISSGASRQGYCDIVAYSQSRRPGSPPAGQCAAVYQFPGAAGCCPGLRLEMVNWGIYQCF